MSGDGRKAKQALAPDAVLFDLDGTLVHTAPGILASFKYAFWQFGIVMSDKQLWPFMGPPLRASFGSVLAAGEVERAVMLYREYYAGHGLEGCSVFPGVMPMLEHLRKAGYTLCVATSKVREAALLVLKEYGLLDFFDYVGGASMDASLDTKTAVIQHVMAQPCMLGKRAVMVGDRSNDMQGAKDCGLPAVGVLYGYASPGELEAFAPVYLAGNVPDLEEWLLSKKYGV